MDEQKRKSKFLKILFLVVGFLVIGGFFANWYLTHRLENYLKETLNQKVSEATDGFYNLQFDTLSIGLFSGELLIRGVEFQPDSAVFNRLLLKDSLPDAYFKVKIGSIYLQGINLTWRWSYKKLDFDLFEIKHADINVYDLQLSEKNDKKISNQQAKTLHEMISPFIDVLTVKKINLENMTAVYNTDDGATPSQYALRNVNFHAYGFLLDSDSYTSGKLLYCDNFDFAANQPQVLLSNSQFTLNTEKIQLNTVDSIINIEGIDLLPQKKIWEQVHQIPDNYVDAKIRSVDVKGIQFVRDNALNYLDARLFEIGASDIEYFSTKRDSIETVNNDTIDLSWSLYSIISPILHRVSIQNISIGDARFKYSQSYGADTNVYTLDTLDLKASNFLVDSLTDTDIKSRFLHSENFALRAKGINGVTPEKNYKFGIDQMLINTVRRNFHIENISLGPITANSKEDYVSGNIKAIDIDSLMYNNGIEAGQLTISSPVVEYVKMPGGKKKSKPQKTDTIQSHFWDQMIPFFDHLLVRNIKLNEGNIIFNDRSSKNRYNIQKLDFYANDILINERIVDSLGYFFACDDFGFQFDDFDSFLSDRQYRLQIKDASFSKKKGTLRLKDIKLIPQKSTWKRSPDTYFDLSIPLVDVRGLNINVDKNSRDYKIGSFNLVSPKINIVKIRQSISKTQNPEPIGKVLGSVMGSLKLGLFNLTNASVSYIDKVAQDSLISSIKSLRLKSLAWEEHKKMRIEEITFDTPLLSMVKNNKNQIPSNNTKNASSLSDLFSEGFSIGKFEVLNMKTAISQPDLQLTLNMSKFNLAGAGWGNDIFNINVINIESPDIVLNEKSQQPRGKLSTTNESTDLYTLLGRFSQKLSVNNFALKNANIDYNHERQDSPTKHQKLNKTNLIFEALVVDNVKKTYSLNDIDFQTKDFHFPLDNGFYTMRIDNISLSKQKSEFKLENIALIPAYSKTEFAYRHPKHKDWFDVTVGNVTLSGIDLPTYFSSKILNADNLLVNDVVLQNFKNQQIEIEHNVMPMIYEGLQDLPLKLSVKDAEVRNFSVIYEELPKKNNVASRIFFTEMNGKLKGLTNVALSPNQFIQLDADGKLMGTGYFTATWMLPVEKQNDCFYLDAHLHTFDLRELNQLITPMAPTEVKSGMVNDVKFNMEASSQGASIDMLMLYNDLKVNVLKNSKDSTQNKFMTWAANAVLKSNNPDNKKKKPREVHAVINRDPYHSTFNYLWQILQPPLVESVGISQGKQHFMKKVTNVISKVKNFFKGGEKKTEKQKKKQDY